MRESLRRHAPLLLILLISAPVECLRIGWGTEGMKGFWNSMVDQSARSSVCFSPLIRDRHWSARITRNSTLQGSQLPGDASRPLPRPWRRVSEVKGRAKERGTDSIAMMTGFLEGSRFLRILPETMGWRYRQGRKTPEPKESEADPARTAQRILSMLLDRAKSNPDQKWMQVDLEVIRNVDRESLRQELWVLGCECEEYEDWWYISLMGQTRGKNVIEKYLEDSFGVIGLGVERQCNIEREKPFGTTDIDLAVYRDDQSGKWKNQKENDVPDGWVEVAHYSASDDVKRVREKFNVRKVMQDCQETIFCFLAIPSLAELEKCGSRFPWRDSSYPFEACTEVLSSYEEARKQAMSAKPKHFILGVWQLDPKNERTFDCGGEWYMLTVDNYVDLELKWSDGQSSRLLLHGIDLVHADDKVKVKYSSMDENYESAMQFFVGRPKFTREAGPGYSTMEGKQGVAAYRKFTMPMNKPK